MAEYVAEEEAGREAKIVTSPTRSYAGWATHLPTFSQQLSDGHGAGQKLLARYDGFSKQRNTALRKLISTMKHTSGTSCTKNLTV